jgi:prepilin-type N-terminal cleavage/methylation domain-containing protein
MKTKKGFTLTELLLVVALIGIIVCIAVPIYNGFTKSARIRNCSAARIKVKAQAESWCKDNFYNDSYSYMIVNDGENVSFLSASGTPLPSGEAENLRVNIHDNDVPYCPSCGNILVVVEPRASGIPKITVTCDGGKDGDCHKTEG